MTNCKSAGQLWVLEGVRDRTVNGLPQIRIWIEDWGVDLLFRALGGEERHKLIRHYQELGKPDAADARERRWSDLDKAGVVERCVHHPDGELYFRNKDQVLELDAGVIDDFYAIILALSFGIDELTEIERAIPGTSDAHFLLGLLHHWTSDLERLRHRIMIATHVLWKKHERWSNPDNYDGAGATPYGYAGKIIRNEITDWEVSFRYIRAHCKNPDCHAEFPGDAPERCDRCGSEIVPEQRFGGHVMDGDGYDDPLTGTHRDGELKEVALSDDMRDWIGSTPRDRRRTGVEPSVGGLVGDRDECGPEENFEADLGEWPEERELGAPGVPRPEPTLNGTGNFRNLQYSETARVNGIDPDAFSSVDAQCAELEEPEDSTELEPPDRGSPEIAKLPEFWTRKPADIEENAIFQADVATAFWHVSVHSKSLWCEWTKLFQRFSKKWRIPVPMEKIYCLPGCRDTARKRTAHTWSPRRTRLSGTDQRDCETFKLRYLQRYGIKKVDIPRFTDLTRSQAEATFRNTGMGRKGGKVIRWLRANGYGERRETETSPPAPILAGPGPLLGGQIPRVSHHLSGLDTRSKLRSARRELLEVAWSEVHTGGCRPISDWKDVVGTVVVTPMITVAVPVGRLQVKLAESANVP